MFWPYRPAGTSILGIGLLAAQQSDKQKTSATVIHNARIIESAVIIQSFRVLLRPELESALHLYCHVTLNNCRARVGQERETDMPSSSTRKGEGLPSLGRRMAKSRRIVGP